jgi:hypothetical protein
VEEQGENGDKARKGRKQGELLGNKFSHRKPASGRATALPRAAKPAASAAG